MSVRRMFGTLLVVLIALMTFIGLMPAPVIVPVVMMFYMMMMMIIIMSTPVMMLAMVFPLSLIHI